MKFLTLLSTACLLGMFSIQAQEKSQLVDGSKGPLPKVANSYRILYVGDSITMHGTNPEVLQALKWDHAAGMAASKLENDYAHRFAALVQGALPNRVVQMAYPVIAPNFAAAINQYGLGTAGQNAATIQSSESLHPNLVVIQLGEHEHERPAVSDAEIRANYEKLLTSFDSWTPRPAILCTGTWYPQNPGPGDAAHKYQEASSSSLDKIVSKVCQAHNIPFVSVESLATDPSCRGWGQNSGVQWHPNDKGHEGYATLLFEAFKTLPQTN